MEIVTKICEDPNSRKIYNTDIFVLKKNTTLSEQF
jgi:hypothetical protein